jgi:tetratricopeptide (TPR) repeat protein
MTSEKVHHHVFANPAAESKSAGVLEDEFLTLESLVAIKNTAAARRQKQVLADIEELMRENRWEDIVVLIFPVEDRLPELIGQGLDTRIREKLAFALGQMARFDEAIKELQICLEREPENFHLHSSLAYTAYNSLYAAKNREIFLSGKIRSERIRLAHTHFQAAQALRPDGVTNFYRQGMLFKQIENKPAPALPLFQKAFTNWDRLTDKEKQDRHQEHKNFIKALYQLAGALLQAFKPEDALDRIKRCLAEDEQSNHLSLVHKYFALGKVNFHLNRLVEAKDALLFAMQCRSKEPIDFVYELLGRTYLALGKAERALEILNKLPEKNRRPYYRWTEADVLCALQDFETAKQVLARSVERDQRSRHKGLLRLAKIEYLLQNFEKAQAHAAEADRFFREKWGNAYAEGLFWQALAAFRLGDIETAQRMTVELESTHPNFPELVKIKAQLAGSRQERNFTGGEVQ